MIGLFDTHAHFEGTADEVAEILRRAVAAGVTRVMAVGGSVALNAGVRRAVEAGEALGVKVLSAIGWDREQITCQMPPLDATGCAAVGEIGLDYHYSPETREAQRSLFASELERARRLGLPVVIHTRDADDDTLGILREIPSRGVIHCFTGSPSFCRALLDLGFMISISGIVTFRLADNVRESARVIPDDRLLIETDSPFLAPVPFRGRANEPAYLVQTARFLADLRGTSFEELVEMTAGNGVRLFEVGGKWSPAGEDN